jgi:hypothetical protein
VVRTDYGWKRKRERINERKEGVHMYTLQQHAEFGNETERNIVLYRLNSFHLFFAQSLLHYPHVFTILFTSVSLSLYLFVIYLLQ